MRARSAIVVRRPRRLVSTRLGGWPKRKFSLKRSVNNKHSGVTKSFSTTGVVAVCRRRNVSRIKLGCFSIKSCPFEEEPMRELDFAHVTTFQSFCYVR